MTNETGRSFTRHGTSLLVSGDITVENVDGETCLKSVSGEDHAGAVGRLAGIVSVSGDIEIAGASSDRTLEITTVSGSVDAADIVAPRLELSSVSGHVEMVGVRSERVEAQSVSSDIEFAGSLVEAGRYELQSHSDDVRVSVGNDRGFDLHASSFSGRIRTDPSMTFAGGDVSGGPRRSLEGRHGDGSARLDLTSFSGNISITTQD